MKGVCKLKTKSLQRHRFVASTFPNKVQIPACLDFLPWHSIKLSLTPPITWFLPSFLTASFTVYKYPLIRHLLPEASCDVSGLASFLAAQPPWTPSSTTQHYFLCSTWTSDRTLSPVYWIIWFLSPRSPCPHVTGRTWQSHGQGSSTRQGMRQVLKINSWHS